jgi:biotin carboxyl carrier protein
LKPVIRVNGEAVEVADGDLVVLSPGHYSVLHGGRVYEVRADGGHMVVNGRRVSVEIDDPRQFQQGAKQASGAGRAVLRSTMPGKVVRLLVSAGDLVEAGQGVLIVEAMKMQNEVKSPRAGTVTQLKVKAEETVAAGAELAVIE